MTKKVLTLDCEATTYEKGNPFSRPNRLMCVGYLYNDKLTYCDIEHSGSPYGANLEILREVLAEAELIVGFNLKYDLHWIRRYIPDVTFGRCWDVQLAEFLLHDQRNPYPSLDFALRLYGFEPKHDIIATDFWDKGIDTDAVPRDILEDRVLSDVKGTYDIYLKQQALMESNGKGALFRLQCQDLLVLQEMEENGMSFDEDKANELAKETNEKLAVLNRNLAVLSECDFLNPNSSHHLSALLYGGTIHTSGKETVTTVTKLGKSRTYERNCLIPRTFPRLVQPLPNTESKHKGIYYTNEDVLRSLKASGRARQIIDTVLEQSELEKLRSTYYEGLPNLINKMAWESSTLHGTFNQCVARTGRLSSARPNLQNFASAIKPLFRSRNGVLLNTDAKGLEWVCAAYLSRDEVARREILDGVDQHAVNQQYFGLPSRLIAKTFMFRLIYGGSAWSYAHDPDFVGVSRRESFWQDIIDKTYAKYRGLALWHTGLVREVVASGKLVMPTGRQYLFERVGGDWPRTQILNYPVQGLGADLLSIIRISLSKRLNKARDGGILQGNADLICTVHDSILIDMIEKDVDTVKEIIDNTFTDLNKNFERVFKVPFTLPLRCETSVGVNWGDMVVLK